MRMIFQMYQWDLSIEEDTASIEENTLFYKKTLHNIS